METSLGRRFALETMGIGMAAGAAGIAEMGAMATITLPPEPDVHPPAGGDKTLRLTDVNGRSFSLKLGWRRAIWNFWRKREPRKWLTKTSPQGTHRAAMVFQFSVAARDPHHRRNLRPPILPRGRDKD